MTIDYRKEVEEYMTKMTEAERMEKYMKGEEVDHLPFGYILNTGCAVVFSTPRENIDAFVYAVRKYGANAVKGKVPEAVYQD